MKKCKLCGIDKPSTTEYFQKEIRVRDGLTARCRKCHNNLKKLSRPKLGYKPKRLDDIKGCRFGKLVARQCIVKTIKGKKRAFWLCDCDCGGQIEIVRDSLINDHPTQSCGCIKKSKYAQSNKRWGGYKNISGTTFCKIKFGALKRNIQFDITIEDIYNQFVLQGGVCALTGIELCINTRLVGRTQVHEVTGSLDRIDSTKPYTRDNIQWLHKDVNLMKNKFSQDYFISICKKIIELNHDNTRRVK